MNKIWVIIVICAIIIIGSIITAFTLAKESTSDETPNGKNPVNGTNESKIILASGEWAPFVSENLLHEGIVSRIVRESFESEGYEVKFEYRPWNRSIEETKNGKWHGTLPWLKNEERENYFYFSEPIAYQQYVVFYHNNQIFTWDNISDFQGFTVGVVDGYSYGTEFDDAIKEGQIAVETTTNDSQNFQKLLAERLDLVLCEINVGYDIIEKLTSADAGNITHAPKSVNEEALYLLLSKEVEENDDLIVIFNQGLQALTESGKVDQYWEESRNGEYKTD